MTKLETAISLARAHKEWEPNLTNVFLVEPIAETDPREPIKLLEVVDGTIERGIEPIAFPPTRPTASITSATSSKSPHASWIASAPAISPSRFPVGPLAPNSPPSS